MTPNDLLRIAQEKGLEVSGHGVNVAALGEGVTVRESLGLKESEAEFQQRVIDLFHLYGWTVAWIRPVRVQRANGGVYYETPMGADGRGWPDLFATRGDRAIAAELKVGKNKATEAQIAWLDRLNKVPGIQTFEWRPEDWQGILKEIA